MTHHVHLVTAGSARAVRAAAQRAAIGTVLAMTVFAPAGDGDADACATDLVDGIHNLAFADPPLLARYPDAVRPVVEPYLRDGDEERLCVDLNFVGVNHYSRTFIRAGEDGRLAQAKAPAATPRTETGWEI